MKGSVGDIHTHTHTSGRIYLVKLVGPKVHRSVFEFVVRETVFGKGLILAEVDQSVLNGGVGGVLSMTVETSNEYQTHEGKHHPPTQHQALA